ncbi:MAG: hypothetical protein QNI89_08555 [Desulfobacterales bacterium]|nr:hypothetical protein [Desulfobacterales bacterium]MDJ0883025.1 hypothetical protein [Desulfobacterales bacterium]MDJ0887336.1 hypothetical protein [Desulfobacterales bacterium]MDJ0989284.1 hypothetical protein [Desulfobacterales bacterium]
MQALFKDIIKMDGVYALVYLSREGQVLFESIDPHWVSLPQGFREGDKLLPVLEKFREADFVFENGRIYMRATEQGYLLVVMGPVVSIAMVKLNCDIILPQLKTDKPGGKLKGFFKR